VAELFWADPQIYFFLLVEHNYPVKILHFFKVVPSEDHKRPELSETELKVIKPTGFSMPKWIDFVKQT
jgi:hypothetical protein